MTPEDIKAMGRRLTDELLNQGDLTVVDELVDPAYTEYLAAERQTVTAADLKDFITEVRHAFPDLHARTEQQIAEGDTLVQRLTVTGTHDGAPMNGTPATGERIHINVVEISQIGPNGTFVKRWTLTDQISRPHEETAATTRATHDS